MGALHVMASRAMGSFWKNRAKIPLADEYNDAITENLRIKALSDALAAAWGVMAALQFVAP